MGVGRVVNWARWCRLRFKNTTIHTLTARFRNESIPLDTGYSKIECEKLHIKFCKRVMSTNFAVLSELGRFPIHYQIIKQMLEYWHHLENLESSFPLLKAAYNSSKKLFLLRRPSWYGSIHYINEKNTRSREISIL